MSAHKQAFLKIKQIKIHLYFPAERHHDTHPGKMDLNHAA